MVEKPAGQSPSGRGTSRVTPHRYPQLEDNSNCPRWAGHIWTHREQGVVAVIERLPMEEQMQVMELLERLEQGYPRMGVALELGHSQQARPECRLRTISRKVVSVAQPDSLRPRLSSQVSPSLIARPTSLQSFSAASPPATGTNQSLALQS
jgi:hypothetical protein